MRGMAANILVDVRFEMPPQFIVAERRMAGRALDRWRASGRGLVDGFDQNSLVVTDIAGFATIESVGAHIAESFGLAAGMRLVGLSGLAAEVLVACDLITIDPQPLAFESSLSMPGCAVILARGIALPIVSGRNTSLVEAANSAQTPDRVQIVVNWREVLDHVATARLRRDLRASMRLAKPILSKSDPFFTESSR